MKFTFETLLIYNEYKNYHKYRNRKCVSIMEILLKMEEEEDDKPESKSNKMLHENVLE